MGIIGDLLYSNKTGKLAVKGLDAHARRALLITSNIANAETPGYKAVDLKPFEKALETAYRPGIGMTTTNQKHMGGFNQLSNFKTETVTSKAPARLDGNNVNIDKEMANMAENTLMYQTIITAMRKRGQIIKTGMEPAR